MRFLNREEAGQRLAQVLTSYAAEQPIVLALPRGGVPVAYPVAKALHAPLNVWVVRKIGVPWHPELGVGAIAEGGSVYLNQDILDNVGLSDDELAGVIQEQEREVTARVKRFRFGGPQPALEGRTVIVVDDGIATGGTVRAAIRSIRSRKPKKVVLAVPVAALDTIKALEPEVDELVALRKPRDLYAIGLWYEDFNQVPDEEVVRLLERSRVEGPGLQHATP